MSPRNGDIYTQHKLLQPCWLNNGVTINTVINTIIIMTLLFQQCSAVMKQQRLFTVVETAENNIDRTSLFVIVIIVA